MICISFVVFVRATKFYFGAVTRIQKMHGSTIEDKIIKVNNFRESLLILVFLYRLLAKFEICGIP